MILNEMDVKTAFLNGVLEKKLYMKVPEGMIAQKDMVCKLKNLCMVLSKVPDVGMQDLINLF